LYQFVTVEWPVFFNLLSITMTCAGSDNQIQGIDVIRVVVQF